MPRGEANWMIAGSGITHSERFDHARIHGAHMQGIQAWVALPQSRNSQSQIAPPEAVICSPSLRLDACGPPSARSPDAGSARNFVLTEMKKS